MQRIAWWAFLALFFCGVAPAEVRIPALLSDHMVLQQDAPVRIWGWCRAGEQVRVDFQGQHASTTGDAQGRWSVWLIDIHPGPSQNLSVRGDNQIVVHDVLVGEVWLASGQSNMERAVHFSPDLKDVQSRALNRSLRLFHADHAVRPTLAEDLKGSWVIADDQSILNFSGTGYFFAEDLQKSLHQPVGVIESAFGGTPIESWMSAESLASDKNLAFVNQEWDDFLSKYPDLMAEYQTKYAAWLLDLSPEDRSAVQGGKMLPGAPAAPRGVGSRNQPSGLFNGMIAPITPYSIRGIVWYQGENNNKNPHEAYYYRELFATMIEDWRKAWGEGEIPFYLMQLSRYRSNGNYPLLRESQMKALKLANTGMVVTADVGMIGDVHYPDKQTVGQRLSRAVQKGVYHKSDILISPQPRMLSVEKGSLRIWFDSDAGSGMKIKVAPLPVFGPLTEKTPPERTADGKSIEFVAPSPESIARAVLISGADGVFYPAAVKTDGASILVGSPKVEHPTQVCYAWDDKMPALLLWNSAGLPAPPFRMAVDPRAEPACPDGANYTAEN